MTKKRLNWREIWKRFDKWCTGEERRISGTTWEFQQKKIAELVEETRNEEFQERKRKTRK